MYALNNPILNIDINGDSTLAYFYNPDGTTSNTIPDVVANQYRNEYGIELGYNSETHMLGGSVIEGATKISALGQGEMMNHLGTDLSPGTLVFGYDLGYYSDDGVLTPISGGHAFVSTQTAIIDLADYDSQGNTLNAQFPAGLDKRVFNMARTVEHEFLGHAIGKFSHQKEGFKNYENSKIEKVVNNIRKDLNLPIRISYSQLAYGGDQKKLRAAYPFIDGITFRYSNGSTIELVYDGTATQPTTTAINTNGTKK